MRFLSSVALLSVLQHVTSAANERRNEPNTESSRPNIVFILTDDQDLHLNSLDYLPLVNKYITEKGTSFEKHYCTVSLCCPSRVSLLTGKHAHNTNVTDVQPPFGGYPKFIEEGLNDNYLPVWLQNTGYSTYYTGKLFNGLSIDNYDKPFANGFDGSDFLLDPNTYQYYNATFQRNHDAPITHPGEYSTDLVAEKTLGFIDDAVTGESPFFILSAPIAPHCSMDKSGSGGIPEFGIPEPAERHRDLFADATAPRTPNFNPDQASGANYVLDLPKMNQTVVDYNDEFHRERIRALQAVDELVEGVVKKLEDKGVLDNTYVIFSSDNGFHIGNHRMPPGKNCGYEEDIHVPLIIRGPGVKEGGTSNLVTSHTDVSPMIMQLIGEGPRADFDGVAFPIKEDEIVHAEGRWQEHVNVEYWGYQGFEGKFAGIPKLRNTYKSLRVIGENYNLYFSVWCTNEHELYDMKNDPYQMDNIAEKEPFFELLGRPREQVRSRLDALMLVLKTCKGSTCIQPWRALHPSDDVANLREALNEKYDSAYRDMPKVRFEKCTFGYFAENEMPNFGENMTVS